MDSYTENEIKKGQAAPDLFWGSKEDSADSVCCFCILKRVCHKSVTHPFFVCVSIYSS